MDTGYTPIDCNFYDVLEARATLQQTAEWVILQPGSEPLTLRGVLTHLFSRAGVEYLRIDHGPETRLDHLVRVDGLVNPSVRTA